MGTRSAWRRRLHVWITDDLRALGVTRYGCEQLVRKGRLRKLGLGWYGDAETPPAVAGALSRGHRLTCISAARIYGLWTPDRTRQSTRIHEASRRNTGAETDHLVLRHLPVIRAWPDDEPVLPLPVALSHAVTCLDAESAAVLLESALEKRQVTRAEVEGILAQASVRRRRAIGRVSSWAGSGSETRVRRYLERRGVKITEQARLFGSARVDLLVGDRLIVECDSWAYHGDRGSFMTDRARDRTSLRGGYLVLRLTWEDVWISWERTKELLTDLVRRMTHRGPLIGRGRGGVTSASGT